MTNSVNTNVSALVASRILNHAGNQLHAVQKKVAPGFTMADEAQPAPPAGPASTPAVVWTKSSDASSPSANTYTRPAVIQRGDAGPASGGLVPLPRNPAPAPSGQADGDAAMKQEPHAGLGAMVDADLTVEAATLTSNQIKQQLVAQPLGIANQRPQSILGLFR
jgi:hypothetical protein